MFFAGQSEVERAVASRYAIPLENSTITCDYSLASLPMSRWKYTSGEEAASQALLPNLCRQAVGLRSRGVFLFGASADWGMYELMQ